MRVPAFMKEIVAALTAELRRSPHINHRSGVTVRYSIGNVETLSAAAVRRAARAGEPEAVPRLWTFPRCSRRRRAGSSSTPSRRAVRTTSCPAPCAPPSWGLPSPAVGVRLPTAPAPLRRGADRRNVGPDAGSDLLAQFGDLPGLSKLLDRLGVEEESPGWPRPRSSSCWRGSTCPGA